MAALATALFSAGLLTAAQPVSAPHARADGQQAVAPYFTSGITTYELVNGQLVQVSLVGTGTNALFRIFGSGFPAEGNEPPPPAFQVVLEYPDLRREYIGANLKSGTELRADIPREYLTIGNIKVFVQTLENDHWLPSEGQGFALLQVRRSSSDINCDGWADAPDALTLMNVIAGLDVAPKNCSVNANKVGDVDIADVTWILQETAGLIRMPLISSTP